MNDYELFRNGARHTEGGAIAITITVCLIIAGVVTWFFQ